MHTQTHDIACLFAQLGLAANRSGIDGFVATHGPLPADMPLHEAPFWNRGQAAFLREGLLEDSDWAATIDALNVMLHARPQ